MTRRKAAAAPHLYTCPQLPDRWVGTDAHGALVHWPAIDGGWTQRTPYLGHRSALREVDPALARGTGWPGSGPGRPRLAGAETGKKLTIKLDGTRRAAMEAIAELEDVGLSDVARAGIDLVIARGSTR